MVTSMNNAFKLKGKKIDQPQSNKFLFYQYLPLLTTPETTVPTNGTEKVSFTWNSNGALESNFPWYGRQFRKVRTKFRPSPVTFDT
jgi:hypothetical protein